MTLLYAPLPERAILRVSGNDARAFLQGLVSNNLLSVSPTRAIYAALLSPQGKFLHDFFIVEQENTLLLDCERARMDELTQRLMRYKLRAQVSIAPAPEYQLWAGWGEGAPKQLGLAGAGAARVETGGILYADPRHEKMGVRFIAPAGKAAEIFPARGFEAAAWEEYEAHRLKLGIADGSRDIIVDRMFLLEAGFDDLHGVDFNKGCYVGQEVTARSKHRGGVRKFLFRVSAKGDLPPAGTPLMQGGKEVGEMRSSLKGDGIALLRAEGWQAMQAGAQLLAGGTVITPSLPEWARVQFN